MNIFSSPWKTPRQLSAENQVDWVYHAPGKPDRIEAFFSGTAYQPHRHDTYTIGMTLGGVQSFKYRGETRHSLPGEVLVLHPDETHDGHAGNEDGFHYRVMYIEPALIQSVLGGKPLPFIESGTTQDPRLQTAVMNLLSEYRYPLAPLASQDGIYDLAVTLDEVSGERPSQRKSFDFHAAELARQYLCQHLDLNTSLEDLERVSGRNRWKLSRDFRVLFGTSPYRYLVMRRLDQVRERLLRGDTLADVAFACQFADQSHMNRHFKKAFGLTPKQWLKHQKYSPRT